MINWVERQQETTLLSFPRSHGLSQDIKETEDVETHEHLSTEEEQPCQMHSWQILGRVKAVRAVVVGVLE